MDPRALLDLARDWLGDRTWIAQVFAVVLATLLASYAARRLLLRLEGRLGRTEIPWDEAIVDAARRPLAALVWVVGLAFAAEIALKETGAAILLAAAPARNVGVIATLAWFLIRLTRNVERTLIERREREGVAYDRTTVEAVGRILRASVVITAVLVALQTLGYSISGVLAFGGIGGIAVGFAAKDLLANFFGGLMVYLDRPFAVGDWIRSPDREIEGTVEEIGWRLTRIRTFDKRPIYVPNSVFTTIAVENPQRMTHRRIYETIGIRYADVDKMAAITAAVREMLAHHPAIDASQTLMVHFNRFGPSSLDFFVYCFTHTTVWTEFHRIKEEILLKIAAIVADHGAEIAFPTRTVHLEPPLPPAEPAAEG
ncbi:MAG: mechanosensitive ion channel family protein [Nitrospirae bacterium]|nr:MAG: mechanosensitive ion channel family protein [Nitrospirota bacterium]